MNVAEVRTEIVNWLESFGYEPRDADPTDFARFPHETRFKVGTVYGEVTVTAVKGQTRVGVIRVVSAHQINDALSQMRGWMA